MSEPQKEIHMSDDYYRQYVREYRRALRRTMSAAAERTALKHLDAIRCQMVTRSIVIGLRKLINAAHRKEAGYSIGVGGAVSMNSCLNIMDAIEQYHPNVIGKLQETGIALLQSPRYKRQLVDVAPIVADLSHFKLVSFEMIDATHCVPVYRAYDREHRWFDYRHVPWQSGGTGPEVIRCARVLA